MRIAHVVLCGAVAVAAGDGSLSIRDVDGGVRTPFSPSRTANVLFLVSSDCPVSNGYAPEIQRVCRDYAARGVSCLLVYEDVGVDGAVVRRHLADYRYRGIPAAIDADRAVATRVKATVTPSAVVVDNRGAIRYRGRIDNLYAALGKPRQRATVHDLSEALDAVLAGKPVAHPETESFGCFIVSPDALRK